MGYTQALAFAEAVEDGDIDLRRALSWHLQVNHFPPVPVSMVPVCEAAIELAREDEWDVEIELPEGVSYRGEPTAPVSAIVEAHHLEAFL